MATQNGLLPISDTCGVAHFDSKMARYTAVTVIIIKNEYIALYAGVGVWKFYYDKYGPKHVGNPLVLEPTQV
jgi:hypothetical protein